MDYAIGKRVEYQGQPGCLRVRHQMLQNVPVFLPAVDEGELKEFCVHTPKHGNVRVTKVTKLLPHRHLFPQNLYWELNERPLICVECAPPLPLPDLEWNRREKL